MARVTPSITGTPFISTSTATGTNGSRVVNLPTGLVANDLIVVAVRDQHGGTDQPDYVFPSGWVRLGPNYERGNGAYRMNGFFGYLIPSNGSYPSNITITRTGGSTRAAIIAYGVRDVDMSVAPQFNSVSANLVGYAGTAITNGRQYESYTTTVGTLTMFLGSREATSGGSDRPATTPSGFTEIANAVTAGASTTSRTCIWTGYRVSQATSTGTIPMTWDTAGTAQCVQSISLTGKEQTIVIPTGLELQIGSSGVKVYTRVWVAPTEIPIASSWTFRRGITDSAQTDPVAWAFANLATIKPTMGHRGSSAVTGYPEMSLEGYDYAVQRGHMFMEFSCGRSSDGVWFGCHDASINRTSQTSGLPNNTSMTWAEIQQYQLSLNSNNTPRPYVRLDAFLDRYNSTHICVIDPKHGYPWITDFLDVLDSHGGNKRNVVKFVGAGTSGWSNNVAIQSTNRGYRTGQYYYSSNIDDGSFAATKHLWDHYGMEYTAAQSYWDIITADGKPVVGHVCPTQAAADQARTRGATIIQSAGTDVISPRAWWNQP